MDYLWHGERIKRKPPEKVMNKVLVIAPYPYLPYYSGGQKFIAQFVANLGKEVELTVITVKENDFTLAKEYRSIPLLKKSFTRYVDISLIGKITSLIKREEFDTIIWEHPYYAWLAWLVKRKTGIKTIIHTHNIEYQRFKSTGRWWWPILKQYEKWCFRKADALLFITPEDRNFAIDNWKIEKEKCIDVPFGIEIKKYPEDRPTARRVVSETHGIKPEEKILFFNGVLDYKPNLDALKLILEQINPLLLASTTFKYKIIICGKDLPIEMNNLLEYADKNIIYAGFVDSIDTYFKAADIFLNPVQSGGGIKTKMVEAIAYGATVVATETGAIGILKTVCGQKLSIVADNDWNGFANAILQVSSIESTTPEVYYEYYYWENIIRNMKKLLT